MIDREQTGRQASSSAAVLHSQSVKPPRAAVREAMMQAKRSKVASDKQWSTWMDALSCLILNRLTFRIAMVRSLGGPRGDHQVRQGLPLRRVHNNARQTVRTPFIKSRTDLWPGLPLGTVLPPDDLTDREWRIIGRRQPHVEKAEVRSLSQSASRRHAACSLDGPPLYAWNARPHGHHM